CPRRTRTQFLRPLPRQASMPGAETTPNQTASPPSNSQQYRNSAQHRSPPHQVRVRYDLVPLAPQDIYLIEDENVFQISVYSRNQRSSLHSSPLHPLPPLPHDGQVRIFSRFLLSFHGSPHVISRIQHTIDSLNKNSYVVYVLPSLYSLSA